MEQASDLNTATATAAGSTATTESAPAKDAQTPAAGGSSLLWLIIIWIAALYFFFMRPNRRKEKARKEQIAAIQKGDKIVTIGGIHGVVMKVNDEVLTVRIDDKTGTTMKFSRAAVNTVFNKDNDF